MYWHTRSSWGNYIGACHVIHGLECLLIGGITNQPIMAPSQETAIQDADKCVKFLDLFRILATEEKFRKRVEKLYDDSEKHGNSPPNVDWWRILDNEINECRLGCAKKVAKKKWIPTFPAPHIPWHCSPFLENTSSGQISEGLPLQKDHQSCQ